MKKVIVLFAVAMLFSQAGTCGAAEKRLVLRCITPNDVLTGVGVFIEDTGQNIFNGTKTTIKGLGEIITSPLKARLPVPPLRRT